MSDGYPVTLYLSGKRVVVIGGGSVAERKINKLLNAEAYLTVVSPRITPNMQTWVDEGRLAWKPKTFEPEDVRGATLVFAATDDANVNKHVVRATQADQFVCCVDNQAKSTFTVPSTLERGRLRLSVSTSGASPGLARQIKQALSERYDASYEDYLDFLYESRKRVQEQVTDQRVREAILKALLDDEYLRLTKEKAYEEREARFLALITHSAGTDVR
ncbi:precorrin-2 dehydrogenase/sirohydrochlorin ferrochelatase family protein [Caldalkalibacillus salinus]|uniref:precorrin-2 dehydrogenase/sirohydrochlorin ferrochelatase family protein n=1 Tax=Caldalkalibacillus salinus TaxID=2803787 RepID=UPI001920D767|nr:NAD(P)-dependent oxidoreductase [Caldalkalibacillus salinus]